MSSEKKLFLPQFSHIFSGRCCITKFHHLSLCSQLSTPRGNVGVRKCKIIQVLSADALNIPLIKSVIF